MWFVCSNLSHYSKNMTITHYAVICALINILLLLAIYGLLALRRKSGHSDIAQSRITLVISSFVVPIVVCVSFVVAAAISQKFFQFAFPVGQRGGGVFIILISSVATSIMTLTALLPRIKHQWED